MKNQIFSIFAQVILVSAQVPLVLTLGLSELGLTIIVKTEPKSPTPCPRPQILTLNSDQV